MRNDELQWRGYTSKYGDSATWTTKYGHLLRIEHGNYLDLPNKEDYFLVVRNDLDRKHVYPNGLKTLSAAKVVMRMMIANGQITTI